MCMRSVANLACKAAHRPLLVRVPFTSSSIFLPHHPSREKATSPIHFGSLSSTPRSCTLWVEAMNGEPLATRRVREKGVYCMSVEKNKALVRRFVDEILNQGNMALAPELVAEDYIELDPFPGQQQG